MSDASGVEVLVTAQEAFPKLERLFLDAKTAVVMGFRIFDLRTALRSKAALEIGECWGDLLVHTANRGVRVDLTVSDFDPVMAADMHAQAWKIVSIALALNELTEVGAAEISARCILHPAEGGFAPRLMFALKTRKALARIAGELQVGAQSMRFQPGLRGLLDAERTVRPFALPRLFPVTLHHKMAVFDDQITYIGGLDLNERRYDAQSHDQPAQQTWHDVQLVVDDAGVATDAAAFLAGLPQIIAGKAGMFSPTSTFRTTLSRRRQRNLFHLAPVPVQDGLLQEYLLQIGQARRLIYLETQYFRDRRIVAALVQAAKRAPDLKLLLVLPAAPEDAAFEDHPGLDARFGEYLQARAFRRVRRAFGRRFLALSPVQQRFPSHRDEATERATLAQAPIIYVHAKVAIFDDSAAIVSSANLNGRSMKWDAEAGVVLMTAGQVAHVRSKVFRHWMSNAVPEACLDIETAFAAWRELAIQNAASAPQDRTGFLVPYDAKAGAAIAVPIPGAPEEMV